jgi:cobalamin biosynthesis protein CobT
MNILSTIHSKYQGETMFCFVCVATVFGYILGVNRVIDAILSKQSDETRVKVVKTLNKYTQTNLGDLAKILASNHLILSPNRVVDDVSSSSDHCDNSDGTSNDNNNNGNNDDTNDETNDDTNHDTNDDTNDNSDKQEKKEDEEKQVQENTVISPSSVSTSEEDYELVRKNENVNHLKNKTNMKYFEWLNIF